MENKEAYRIIAKHPFVARRSYAGDATLIIFADTLEDAERKAQEYFGAGTVSVRRVEATTVPQVYSI